MVPIFKIGWQRSHANFRPTSVVEAVTNFFVLAELPALGGILNENQIISPCRAGFQEMIGLATVIRALPVLCKVC